VVWKRRARGKSSRGRESVASSAEASQRQVLEETDTDRKRTDERRDECKRGEPEVSPRTNKRGVVVNSIPCRLNSSTHVGSSDQPEKVETSMPFYKSSD
jgi:hypothetical protein